MASGKGYYLANKLCEHSMGKTSFTMPTSTYMALLTTAVGASTTGLSTTVTQYEPTYTGYARKQLNASSGADLGTASSGSLTNVNALVFAACTNLSSVITAFCTIDSSSGAGNMLYFGTITSKTIDTNNTPPTIGVGALVITEA